MVSAVANLVFRNKIKLLDQHISNDICAEPFIDVLRNLLLEAGEIIFIKLHKIWSFTLKKLSGRPRQLRKVLAEQTIGAKPCHRQ